MSDLSKVDEKILKQQKLIQNAINIMVVPKQQESKLLRRNCGTHERNKEQRTKRTKKEAVEHGTIRDTVEQ